MPIEPLTVLLAAAALATLALVVAAGDFALARRARARRLRAVSEGRTSAVDSGGRDDAVAHWRQGAMQLMKLSTRRVTILKDRQNDETRELLISAGYRGRDTIVVYAFLKLVSPFVACGAAALFIYAFDPIGRGVALDLAAVLAAALAGGRLPDLILKNARDKRLASIRKALPDTLDMLVICAEAGLSTDAALRRVIAQTNRRSTVLGDELHQTALELSFMPERRQALENLAMRAPLPAVVSLVNTLIQAERYGTPLSRAFSVLAQEQRGERMLKAEEKAGRLPATMTVPMMVFILPALFVVLIGSAVLDIMDNYIG